MMVGKYTMSLFSLIKPVCFYHNRKFLYLVKKVQIHDMESELKPFRQHSLALYGTITCMVHRTHHVFRTTAAVRSCDASWAAMRLYDASQAAVRPCDAAGAAVR